jgi:hypothetical protein
MPSMSYCAFENTSGELDQLGDMLERALDSGEPLDLNEYEQRAFENMPSKLRELLKLLEEYEDQFNSDA